MKQVVILAAGRGTRMGALTDDCPKPMLHVAGKTLLEHKFDILPDSIEEIVLVVGYLQDHIRRAYGESYNGRRLTYVEQENIVGGTMDALAHAAPFLNNRFLVLMGDDIYTSADIRVMTEHRWALLAARVPDVARGGSLVAEDGVLKDIVEQTRTGPGLISTNLFALDTRIFEYPAVAKSSGSSELGLPQTVLAASRASGIPLEIIETEAWIQISNPEDIQSAEEILSTRASE